MLALAISGGVSAYQQYSQARTLAADGLRRLKHVQTVLGPLLQHPGIPDAATMQTVEQDLRAAERDFALTRADLGHGVFTLAATAPAGSSALDPVVALTTAADEACLAGLDLLHGAAPILPLLQSDLLAGSSDAGASGAPSTAPSRAPTRIPSDPPDKAPPGLTADMVEQLTRDFESAVAHLRVAIRDVQGADLSALPAGLISTQQRAQIQTLLATWPRIAPQLATVDAGLRVAPELLGLTGPMRLLVEVMDRGETRPAGGYIGNYGVLTIQDGKLQPFSLADVNTLDFPYGERAGWPVAPAAYSWWPWAGLFGLRDSNLSPDFPTSAQMGMRLLAQETGTATQGAVALLTPAIARVLAVVGPLSVPEYHETVTAENLEAKIRQYTENPAILHDLTAAHSRFTVLVGHAFMSKLHGLSTTQLIAIAQSLLTSLRTKDIQVYLSDPAAEALLAQQGFDDALTHGPGDGLTIADANVSSNKSNLFTTLTYTDAVLLDTDGTATHHLTMTYSFDSSRNPSMRYYLYGARIYHTYLRVYAPPSAQLVSLDGFNGTNVQINTSDAPGHQMWGGYVWVWDGVPYSLHFVWSVPGGAAEDVLGRRSYTLTVQRQAGANQQLNLTVAAPGMRSPLISYSGALDQDRTFNASVPDRLGR